MSEHRAAQRPTYGNGLCACGHLSSDHNFDYEASDMSCFKCGCEAFRRPAAPQEGETPGAPIVLDEDAESGPRPEEREYDRLSDRLRDSGLPELECAEGQSCGSLNALRALLDQVQTLREENTQLRYLDGRLNKAGREQFDRAARAEQSLREKDAEIERLNAALDTLSKAVSQSEQGKLIERERTLREALEQIAQAPWPPDTARRLAQAALASPTPEDQR